MNRLIIAVWAFCQFMLAVDVINDGMLWGGAVLAAIGVSGLYAFGKTDDTDR